MKNKIIRYTLPKKSSTTPLFQSYSFQGRMTKDTTTPHRTKLPHSHDFYEIWFFEKGNGRHYIDFKTYDIKPQSIHFIAPNTVHLVQREERNIAYLIAFSAALFDLAFNNHTMLNSFPAYKQGCASPIIELNASNFSSVATIIELMKMESNQSNLLLNASLIHSLLSLAFPLFKKTSAAPSKNILVEKFHQLINKYYTQHYQVSQYAELLKLSPVILNRKIKKLTGVNASKHIQERMILEAKRLLVNTDLSIKEIAFKLGFQESTYFSQYFSKNVDLSPVQFRKRWFKNYSK